MLVILLFFFAVATYFSGRPYFKTLSNNTKRRKDIIKHTNILSDNDDNEKTLVALIEELNFPLATIDCNKQIENIRACLINHEQEISLFCTISDISLCFHNHFAIIGNFVGTEIVPSRHENQSISKLYSANILFRKNDDSTLTLLSTFPEDKDHDFFIKDFVLRLKELLK